MIKGLLILVFAMLAVFVLAKLLYVTVLVLVTLLSGLVRYIVVPTIVGVSWLVYELMALPFRVVALPFRLASQPPHPSALPVGAVRGGGIVLGTPCATRGCRCINPASARFCRRCGGFIHR